MSLIVYRPIITFDVTSADECSREAGTQSSPFARRKGMVPRGPWVRGKRPPHLYQRPGASSEAKPEHSDSRTAGELPWRPARAPARLSGFYICRRPCAGRGLFEMSHQCVKQAPACAGATVRVRLMPTRVFSICRSFPSSSASSSACIIASMDRRISMRAIKAMTP